MKYVSRRGYVSSMIQETYERGTMALTDAGIKALKPRGGRYIVTDGRGLSLEVLPSGKMSWLYRYRLDGKYGKVSLGHYPDLFLKAARDKRDKLAGQVAEGKSPATEQKLKRAGLATSPPSESSESGTSRNMS